MVIVLWELPGHHFWDVLWTRPWLGEGDYLPICVVQSTTCHSIPLPMQYQKQPTSPYALSTGLSRRARPERTSPRKCVLKQYLVSSLSWIYRYTVFSFLHWPSLTVCPTAILVHCHAYSKEPEYLSQRDKETPCRGNENRRISQYHLPCNGENWVHPKDGEYILFYVLLFLI